MELSIIIVSWNVRDVLEQCLRSIFKTHGDISLEVIVVDNNSQDGTARMIHEKFSEVVLIGNPNNRGFAVANNQGILRARGEFLLLLNPDTELQTGTLANALHFLRAKPQAGVVGCKHLNSDRTLQPSVRRFPTFWPIFWMLLKIPKVFPDIPSVSSYYARDFDYKFENQVEQVAGSFFLMRRKVIDEIGMLDENFFIWFEEVDFCKRALAAGWQIWYTPNAVIVHYGGQSFAQELRWRNQKHFFQSAWYYLRKHGFFR